MILVYCCNFSRFTVANMTPAKILFLFLLLFYVQHAYQFTHTHTFLVWPAFIIVIVVVVVAFVHYTRTIKVNKRTYLRLYASTCLYEKTSLRILGRVGCSKYVKSINGRCKKSMYACCWYAVCVYVITVVVAVVVFVTHVKCHYKWWWLWVFIMGKHNKDGNKFSERESRSVCVHVLLLPCWCNILHCTVHYSGHDVGFLPYILTYIYTQIRDVLLMAPFCRKYFICKFIFLFVVVKTLQKITSKNNPFIPYLFVVI